MPAQLGILMTYSSNPAVDVLLFGLFFCFNLFALDL